MKPALKALPPSEWRIMYMFWHHGPLTVAEVHKLSPDHNLTTVATFLKRLAAKGYLTTTLERSSPAGGRPPERFYPRIEYAEAWSSWSTNFSLTTSSATRPGSRISLKRRSSA